MTSILGAIASSRSSFACASAFLLAFGAGCSSSDASPATGGGAGSPGAGGQANLGPEPTLPAAPTDCPTLATGNITVMGQTVQLFVGQKKTDQKGPVLFYWHGTLSHSAEVALMGPAVQEIQDQGGIVASFETSLGTGTNTGNFVWYTDDFNMADYILGCAVQQLNIDTRRIYAAGCSAGGLQAGAQAITDSGYIAAAMTNSGGSLLSTLGDPAHIPSLITAHGSCADKVIIYFNNVSKSTDKFIADHGGIAVDCDHGQGHCGAPADLIAAQWQFLKDHPFGVNPDPYAGGLPSSFPTYCTQYPVADQGAMCP